MSLYANYLLEREGKYILESQEGFIVYGPMKDFMFIQDIYVLPEHRQNKVASTLADKVAELAKEQGFKKLLGSVDLRANGATTSMRALLAYGFSLSICENQTIYLEKDL